jgi:glucosamine--fructose-6-phosphate aminotransferase (isomerizing)
LEPDHADADAVCLVHAFYQLLLRVAERRGRNVDRPRHLQKVTVTR